MTVRIYKSTDTGAPTLSGTAGDLANVLQKVLVDGYNSNNPPGAGWTREYNSGNISVYRPGAGARHYLRINDSAAASGADEATGSAKAAEARVRGYETMTAVSTGGNSFPNTTQNTIGLIWRKSTANSATTRTWIAAADSRTLILFIISADVASGYMGGYFGDFYSVQGSSDSYRSLLIGRTSEQAVGITTFAGEAMQTFQAINAVSTGKYVPRVYSAVGNSLSIGTHGDGIKGSTSLNIGTVAYPNTTDSGIYIAPIWVHDVSSYIYGRVRGLWHFLHAVASVNDGDTFTGTGSLAGKSFLCIKGTGAVGDSTITGMYVLETSDTWETN